MERRRVRPGQQGDHGQQGEAGQVCWKCGSGEKLKRRSALEDLSRNKNQHQQRQGNSDQIGCQTAMRFFRPDEADRYPKQEKTAGV